MLGCLIQYVILLLKGKTLFKSSPRVAASSINDFIQIASRSYNNIYFSLFFVIKLLILFLPIYTIITFHVLLWDEKQTEGRGGA